MVEKASRQMSPSQPKNILIILPRQLGDVLLGTTYPQAIKRQWPNAKVSWLALPMAKQILEGNPLLDEIIYMPVFKAPLKEKNSSGSLLYLFRYFVSFLTYLIDEVRFHFQLRAKKFDAVVDAMNVPRTAVQTLISGAAVRSSFKTDSLRDIAFNHLIERSELGHGYLGFTRLKLLRALGIEIGDKETEFKTFIPISEKDAHRAREIFESALSQSAKSKLVLLSPTHRREVRRWPSERYIELAFELVRKSHVAVMWLWGPGEREFVESLHGELVARLAAQGLSPSLSQIPPLLSLRETAALSGLATGWIGNSNGLSHTAVAGGGKTVELHGPTDPRVWTYPDTERHRGINAGCDCMGSNVCRLPFQKCFVNLSVATVFEEAKSLFRL